MQSPALAFSLTLVFLSFLQTLIKLWSRDFAKGMVDFVLTRGGCYDWQSNSFIPNLNINMSFFYFHSFSGHKRLWLHVSPQSSCYFLLLCPLPSLWAVTGVRGVWRTVCKGMWQKGVCWLKFCRAEQDISSVAVVLLQHWCIQLTTSYLTSYGLLFRSRVSFSFALCWFSQWWILGFG